MHRPAEQEFRLVRGGKPASTGRHRDADRGPARATHLRSVDQPTPGSGSSGDEPVQLTALP